MAPRVPSTSLATAAASLRWAAIVLALIAIAAATALLLLGSTSWAGAAAVIATLGLVVSSLLSDERPLSGFADTVADRLFDGAVVAATVWALRDIDPSASLAALLALAGGFAGAYAVAKGRALGYPARAGWGERAGRCGLVALALVTGWFVPLLWAAAGVTLVVAGIRAVHVPRGRVA